MHPFRLKLSQSSKQIGGAFSTSTLAIFKLLSYKSVRAAQVLAAANPRSLAKLHKCVYGVLCLPLVLDQPLGLRTGLNHHFAFGAVAHCCYDSTAGEGPALALFSSLFRSFWISTSGSLRVIIRALMFWLTARPGCVVVVGGLRGICSLEPRRALTDTGISPRYASWAWRSACSLMARSRRPHQATITPNGSQIAFRGNVSSLTSGGGGASPSSLSHWDSAPPRC